MDFPSIDWHAPWLAAWQHKGQACAELVQQGMDCAAALNAASAQHGGSVPAPFQFVPQSALPPGEAYEAFIFRTGQVPTRQGVHDFFNGLCWLHFPATKRRLNQLQAAQIAAAGIRPVRGAARDALTIFDENAAFLQCPDALWDALSTKDWHRLFVTQRGLWAQSRVLVFGHALLEKLLAPRKSMTAHVYRVYTAAPSVQSMDAWMAQDLSAEKLAGKPFAHLPVLGVPGWCAANEEPSFYADPFVFRAPRAAVQVAGTS